MDPVDITEPPPELGSEQLPLDLEPAARPPERGRVLMVISAVSAGLCGCGALTWVLAAAEQRDACVRAVVGVRSRLAGRAEAA